MYAIIIDETVSTNVCGIYESLLLYDRVLYIMYNDYVKCMLSALNSH